MKEMPKSYDHQGVEDRLYEKWEKNGYFHAEPNPDKEPYCIVIPPPNITGQLHIGHAIDETLQDALIRYKRMAGFETLWAVLCWLRSVPRRFRRLRAGLLRERTCRKTP